MSKTKILFSVGEASGDLLTASLINDLQGEADCFGMGGQHMKDQGFNLQIDLTQDAVMGLVEILKKLSIYRQAFREMLKLLDDKPDLLVCVDFPGFNLRLAQEAKKRGIKVLYYIAPKVWASRPKRLKIIKKCVDELAVIFPFEVDYFKQAGVAVSYVEHPLVKQCEGYVKSYKNNQRKTLALLPGSRLGEVKRLLPIMCEAVLIMQQQYPDMRCILPVASTIGQELLEQIIQPYGLEVEYVGHDDYLKWIEADAAMVASGTATLELALLEMPMVLIYKLNSLTYQIAKRIVLVKYVGLCNIIAGESMVPELLQAQANPEALAKEMMHLFNDQKAYTVMKKSLSTIRSRLKKMPSISLSVLVKKIVVS